MQEVRLGTIGSGSIVHNILRNTTDLPGIRLLQCEDKATFRSLLETTLCVMEVLESARLHAGIHFPCDTP